MTNPSISDDPLAQLFKFDAEKARSLHSGMSVLIKGPNGSGKTDFTLRDTLGPVVSCYTDRNLGTPQKLIAARNDGSELRFIDSWRDYQDVFVPAVYNRKINCRTIVVDTIDFLADVMWSDIQGSKSRLTQSDFGTGLNRLSSTTSQITGASMPRGDHPGYNVIFTSHLGDVTNDSGSLVRTTCAIMGRFKDAIEDYFDYVLLAEKEVKREVVNEGGKKVSRPNTRYNLLTVPPNNYHTCKAPLEWPERITGGFAELSELVAKDNPKDVE